MLYGTYPAALVVSMVLAITLATLSFAVILSSGWDTSSRPELKPPRLEWIYEVIGIVCVFLFAVAATSHWLFLRSGSKTARYHSWLVTGLIVFCALYPFHTFWPPQDSGANW